MLTLNERVSVENAIASLTTKIRTTYKNDPPIRLTKLIDRLKRVAQEWDDEGGTDLWNRAELNSTNDWTDTDE